MQPQRKKTSSVITLWIDSYDDIFSDFDPRPFGERAVSDDFLTQVKRVSRESPRQVGVLKLLVPEKAHQDDHERVIKRRLEDYFADICLQLRAELKRIRSRSIAFIFLGVLLMTGATYISALNPEEFLFRLLRTIFEPGGWFLFWTGLDQLTSVFGKKKAEAQFFNRLENIHVEFAPYK